MNQDTRETLYQLRLPLATFVLAILVSLGAILGGTQYLLHARKELAMVNGRLAEARSRVERITEEEKEIRSYHPRYQALAGKGLGEEERRLDWMDGTREVASQQRLANLAYEISPRRSLALDIPAGNAEPRASQMRLSLSALHEGDVLRLLAGLEEKNMGRFILQNCDLEWQGAQPQKGAVEPRLRGECTLDWITLSLKGQDGQRTTLKR